MGRASKARKTRVSPQGRLDSAVRSQRITAVEAQAVSGARGRAEVLTQLQRIPQRKAALEARARELVDQARELEIEWGVIGAALMVTPQAVAKRYGPRRVGD